MRNTTWASAVLLSAVAVVLAAPATAQLNRGTPEELREISIEERLGARLPLDLEFIDEDGRPVRLGQFFDGEHPVVLTLNYYRCPMLCGLLLNGLLDVLKRTSFEPGRDFQILTVSFDPLEGPELAREKKRNYINAYGKSSAAAGWHFLTGQRDPIKRLTGTVGFHYKWNEEQQQWAHAAALIICTPEGQVSRYLGGVVFDPQTFRLSLIEASDGKIGTLFDQVFLTCFQYHSDEGAYTASARGLMRAGGVVTLVVLGGLMAVYWRRELRLRRRRAAAAGGPAGGPN